MRKWKWTTEEEKMILETAEQNQDSLREAFRDLALKISRTPDAIVTRYYNKLLKNNESHLGDYERSSE